MWCEENEPAHKHPISGSDLFQRHAARKKTGNVDLKMGPKIWDPVWGPRKEKTIRRTQNGVQILHPILGSTLPMFFVVWRRKKSHVV